MRFPPSIKLRLYCEYFLHAPEGKYEQVGNDYTGNHFADTIDHFCEQLGSPSMCRQLSLSE